MERNFDYYGCPKCGQVFKENKLKMGLIPFHWYQDIIRGLPGKECRGIGEKPESVRVNIISLLSKGK